MKNIKGYVQHSGRAIETGGKFEHVMAITLDPTTHYKKGIVRCITSRSAEIGIKGNVDRSELHMITGDSLDRFTIGERFQMKNEEGILKEIMPAGADFIGLEDPDIWIDDRTGLKHLYFTIPFRVGNEHWTSISLGHAVGKDLDALEMTMPVLQPKNKDQGGAKEVSIAPVNKQGVRYNLVESGGEENGVWYSTVRVAIAENMGKPWQFGETIFHPAEHKIPWIGGHASPGPLFPKTFIDVGEGKLLGVVNGREANQREVQRVRYGMFSVGLFIYDYENGKIEWVSPESFIQDSEAKTITFASQFVEQENGTGILYAHVDDSFVRAYTLDANEIKKLLP